MEKNRFSDFNVMQGRGKCKRYKAVSIISNVRTFSLSFVYCFVYLTIASYIETTDRSEKC